MVASLKVIVEQRLSEVGAALDQQYPRAEVGQVRVSLDA